MDLERQKEIAQFVKANPRITLREIGIRYGVHAAVVSSVARKHGACRKGIGLSRNPERDAEIVELLKAGKLTLGEIGNRFGLVRERIRQIAMFHSIGTRAWARILLDPTKAEEARHWVARGVPIAHAAAMVGIKRESLQNYLVRKGYHTPDNDDRAWTKAEDQVLRQSYGLRGAARRIADKLDRTRNEVIGRANRLGLSKPMAKAQMADAHA